MLNYRTTFDLNYNKTLTPSILTLYLRDIKIYFKRFHFKKINLKAKFHNHVMPYPTRSK